MKLSRTARLVLNQYFLRRNRKGKAESPETLFKRVSEEVAKAEKRDAKQYAKEFYQIMASLDFLPNTPTLLNAGKPNQQLAAAFSLPVEDSLDRIFSAIQHAAMIHRSGGGTGFDFSKLRPEGDALKSTGGYTIGPVPFMKIFDAATEEIKKGGIKRGANMGILRIDHPDIMHFISMKKDRSILTNFNISVAITDEFMRSLAKGRSIWLRNPRTGKKHKKVSARRLFNELAEATWTCGDPGVLFIDRIERDNPTPKEGKLNATDSCADQPLLDFEAANLGSINLSNMVRRNKIDWQRLEDTVRLSIRFLDDAIQVSSYPIDETAAIVKRNRKIGLGVMGLADMLIQLRLAYDSEEALDMAEKVIAFIERIADDASKELASDLGTFPNWSSSIYNRKSKHFKGSHIRLRNATRLTISPTGTTSLIAGVSSSIEPIFALFYEKRLSSGRTITHFHPLLLKALKEEGLLNAELTDQVRHYGSLSPIEGIPKRLKKLFATSREINPAGHIRMQAVFQRHIQNAVAKTVNLPKNTKIRDVKQAVHLAYQMGCKGVAVYREGSLQGEVLEAGKERDQRLLFDYY